MTSCLAIFYAPSVRNSVSPSADVPELFGARGRGRGRTEAVSPSVIFCVSAPATRPTGLRGRVLRLKSYPPPLRRLPSSFILPLRFSPPLLWIAFREENLVRGRDGREDRSCTTSALFSGPSSYTFQMHAIFLLANAFQHLSFHSLWVGEDRLFKGASRRGDVDLVSFASGQNPALVPA